METVQRLSTSVDIDSKNIMVKFCRFVLYWLTMYVYSQTGETALHLASKRGHVEVVRVLLEAKADLNILDKVQEYSVNT